MSVLQAKILIQLPGLGDRCEVEQRFLVGSTPKLRVMTRLSASISVVSFEPEVDAKQRFKVANSLAMLKKVILFPLQSLLTACRADR